MNKVIFVVALAIGILALSSLALAEEVVLQVVDKMTTKEDEPIFAEFVTLALIAMGFMVISNGLLLKDWRIYRVFESDASWVIAAIAFVVTTVCIVCLPFGVSFSSVTFVAAAIANFAVVIVLPAFGARKVALFFSFLFYILLGIALFV